VASGFDAGLQLDRPDRTYRPGEAITGQVVLRVREELTRCEVRVALYWRTSGKGDVEQGQPEALDLVLDERLDVGARSLPFSFTAPDGPPTVHGRLVNVDWVLYAFVRTSHGAADLHDDLVLVAARSTVLDGKPRGSVRSRSLARPKTPDAADLSAAALLGGISLIGLAIGLNGGEGWMCGCGLPGLVAGLCAAALVPGALAARRLGPVTLEVADEVAPGEHLRVALSFTPPQAVALNAIRVTLRAEESATSGSGSDAKTEKHQAFFERLDLSGPTTVGPSGFTGEVELRLPPDAPPSFATSKNSIRWTLQVEVDIPSWPDWRVELPIFVVPSGTAVVTTVRRSIAIQPRQRCPYCRDAIASADPTPVASCGGCATVLHEACWEELGRCPTRGCGRDRPRVRARGGAGT
jgi:hypothetical protein